MAPGAHPEIRRYEPVIGTWRTEGELLGEDGAPVAAIEGRDLYDWLGEAFVVHRIDVDMGGERVRGVEMIGPYLGDGRGFATRAYGHDGSEQTSTSMVLSERVFTFGADGARARLEIAEDGRTGTAEWEHSDDGGATWRPWIHLRFTRLDTQPLW
jgi:hypothetical protein